jgi:hypothetical protein
MALPYCRELSRVTPRLNSAIAAFASSPLRLLAVASISKSRPADRLTAVLCALNKRKAAAETTSDGGTE